jgi:hypothetical protein
MTDLEKVLDRLGLLQYLGRLCEEGFEKWEAVMDITEQDLLRFPAPNYFFGVVWLC